MALQLAPRIRPRRTARAGTLMTTHSGRTLRLREGTPRDLALLDELAALLSPETRTLRWVVPLPPEAIMGVWRQMWQSEPAQTVVVAETVGAAPQLVAVGQLAPSRTHPVSAEIALVVRDDYQHDGVGSQLCQMLGRIAQARGVQELTATMLAENRGMAQLLHKLGVAYRTTRRNGETEISIDLPQRQPNRAA